MNGIFVTNAANNPTSENAPLAVDAEAEVDRIGQALGARSVQRAWKSPSVSLEALDNLARDLASRVTSTGGRPTDPAWTLSRRVPFRPETWELLQHLAGSLGSEGRSVAPAHLAATFVEERVAELDAAIRSQKRDRAQDGDKQSGRVDPDNSDAASDVNVPHFQERKPHGPRTR